MARALSGSSCRRQPFRSALPIIQRRIYVGRPVSADRSGANYVAVVGGTIRASSFVDVPRRTLTGMTHPRLTVCAADPALTAPARAVVAGRGRSPGAMSQYPGLSSS